MLTEHQRNEMLRIARKDPVGAVAVLREQLGTTPEARCVLMHLEAEARYLVETREQAQPAGAQEHSETHPRSEARP